MTSILEVLTWVAIILAALTAVCVQLFKLVQALRQEPFRWLATRAVETARAAARRVAQALRVPKPDRSLVLASTLLLSLIYYLFAIVLSLEGGVIMLLGIVVMADLPVRSLAVVGLGMGLLVISRYFRRHARLQRQDANKLYVSMAGASAWRRYAGIALFFGILAIAIAIQSTLQRVA